MAKEKLSEDTMDTLVTGVAALVKAQNEKIRDVPITEIRPITPWNPTGERRTKKYKKFYMNGALLNPDLMSVEELDLFAQLRPGRYNSRRWEVVRRRDKSLDIRYRNKTFPQRMEMKGDAPALTDMLKKIITEQEAQAERRKRGEYDEDDD